MTKELAKADHVRWDLSIMYNGVDDPQIDKDVAELVSYMQTFAEAYRGKLDSRLGAAIGSLCTISMLQNKIGLYLGLRNSLNTNDAAVKAKSAELSRKMAAAAGAYMTFFDIELANLPEGDLSAQMSDPVVSKHKPFIDDVRIMKPFQLTEEVESALTKRSPFGPGSWSDFFNELESDLRFDFHGKPHTLEEITTVLSKSQDAAERAEAMQILNDGLKGMFAKYSAETLYMVTGSRTVERAERGYKHPMQGRNLSNKLPDAVVDALHAAVTTVAAPLAQRFYKLKAAHIGVDKLRWSDRNAPMPFKDESVVPYEDGMQMVLDGYESFSPTLANLIREMIAKNRIDAAVYDGKQNGAYNASVMLPGSMPASFTLLNYLGTGRDVMTVAHELGHGVHGILGYEAQGALMGEAPIALCETASVFGEAITFRSLRQRMLASGDTKSLLALIVGKLDDTMNTVVRQIGFSNFERRLHGMDEAYAAWHEPPKRSVEEVSAIWDRTLEEMYGDALSRENTSHLWAYIHHFHRPFYVYGYACGELVTAALMTTQERLGEKFPALYLDLLRSAGTKSLSELLAPFGLDPAKESFWADAIKASMGTLLAEAERLSAEMGVTV